MLNIDVDFLNVRDFTFHLIITYLYKLNYQSMNRLLLLILISTTLTLSSLSSNANGVDIAPHVLQSFNSSFKNVTEVKWTSIEDYYKADFIFNYQCVSAYYDHEGKLMAITRHILSNQISVSLQADLKKNYEDYWISDLFELNNDQGTYYFVTLEKPDVTLILKSNLSSSWNLYKKINK